VRLGCGVGNFNLGRVSVFMTESKNDRRRLKGVTGPSSCNWDCRCNGVWRGIGSLKRALGRGRMAGVGVNTAESAGEEKVLAGIPRERVFPGIRDS
jgi:hypothetical protein